MSRCYSHRHIALTNDYNFTAPSVCRDRALPGSGTPTVVHPLIGRSIGRSAETESPVLGPAAGQNPVLHKAAVQNQSQPLPDRQLSGKDGYEDAEGNRVGVDDEADIFQGLHTFHKDDHFAHDNSAQDIGVNMDIDDFNTDGCAEGQDPNCTVQGPEPTSAEKEADREEDAANHELSEGAMSTTQHNVSNNPRASWDNGEEITAEERNVLLGMDSDEERARVMNLRYRDRGLLERGEIDKILPIQAKPAYDELKAAKAKTKKQKTPKSKLPTIETEDSNVNTQAVESEEPRRSSRNQKQTPLALPTSRSTLDTALGSPLATNITVASPASGLMDVDESLATSNKQQPEWMLKAVPHLRGMSSSAQWESLVSQWIKLEGLLQYPTGRVRT